MESIVCVKPGHLAVEPREVPQGRSADDVLLRIRRVGICGTDYHIFDGLHPFLEYPRVMGHELSAEVVEAPPGCPLKAGEIVVVNPYLSCGTCIACRQGKPNCCVRIAVLGVHRDGGMCEWMTLPVANLLSAGSLSVDEAASVEFLAIGAHAVRRAGITGGRTVLVIGAGPIGLGTAIFASLAGADVRLLDRDVERLALAKDITGIEYVFSPDGREAVAEATNGDGFDCVVDATGNRESIEAGFNYVAHGGAYVLVSVVKGSITFVDAEFHKRETTLIGSRNATMTDFENVIGAIAAGRVPVAKLVTHRTTLAGAVDHLPRWSKDKRGLVKAMIHVS